MEAKAAELEAILHGAAVAPLSAPGYERFARAFLRITGSDATRWLNGMVTNSVQALQPGEGNYNFLLNAQGRIQADCTIYRKPGEGEPAFLLETDSSQLATVQETLDRFIIMDDVELTPSDHHDGMAVLLGPEAPKLLRSIAHPELEVTGTFSDLVPLRLAHYELTASQITTPAPGLVPSFEIASGSGVQNLMDEVRSAGAVEVSPEALDAFRILSGKPRYGEDIRNTDTARDLPQETSQTHALHFSKGCYLGQEIVERIRSRGQVHRLFTRFRLEGDLPSTLPAPLQVDGKPAGELTSAALVPLPAGPELLALGYARREPLETGKQFTYLGGTATPLPAS